MLMGADDHHISRSIMPLKYIIKNNNPAKHKTPAGSALLCGAYSSQEWCCWQCIPLGSTSERGWACLSPKSHPIGEKWIGLWNWLSSAPSLGKCWLLPLPILHSTAESDVPRFGALACCCHPPLLFNFLPRQDIIELTFWMMFGSSAWRSFVSSHCLFDTFVVSGVSIGKGAVGAVSTLKFLLTIWNLVLSSNSGMRTM